MFDHDDVQRSIVRIRAGDPQSEETAENGRVDDREVDQTRLLLPVFPLHLTAKDRALPECHRHRHGVIESSKTRPQIGSGREASEAYVEPHGCSVDEMTGLLTLSGEAPRVDSRDTAPGEQPDRMLDVHRNADRPGEIVRGAEGNDAEHDRCPNNGVGDGADGSVAACRNDDARMAMARQQPRQKFRIRNGDLGGDLQAHGRDRLPCPHQPGAMARAGDGNEKLPGILIGSGRSNRRRGGRPRRARYFSGRLTRVEVMAIATAPRSAARRARWPPKTAIAAASVSQSIDRLALWLNCLRLR